MRAAKRVPLAAAVLITASVVLAGCAWPWRGGPPPDEQRVRIAAGPDAETVLLASTMAALLELDGVPAQVVPFSDSRDAVQALELGAVQARPGYTGESLLEVAGTSEPPSDPHASYLEARVHDARRGITWLRPHFGEGLDEPPVNATFAFVVQPALDGAGELRTMSELASRLSAQPDALVCVDQEFAQRPDGLAAVLSAYSVRSDRRFLAADPREAVLGVAAGDCLAGLTTATDGHAWREGLRPLVDDLRVFPAFLVLPQIRDDALDEHPAIRRPLGAMANHLSAPLLGQANARVVAGEPIEDVARELARELGVRSGFVQPEATT